MRAPLHSPILGIVAGHAVDEVPASHRDLIECPPVAALTTLMPDGYPQTSVVWCDTEADVIRVNTMRGFQKERNMRRDPRIALLGYDPARTGRYLEIRGTVVSMTEDGAGEHLDAIASKYAGRPVRYFGECIPSGFAATERPVLCRIRPRHVVAMDAGGCEPGATAVPGVSSEPDIRSDFGSITFDGTSTIPADHVDLLTRPICGVLTTLAPDGQPRSSLVWLDHDEASIRVNTTLERQKGRDLSRDPRVSLLVVDPRDTSRFIQIRGDVDLTRDGAVDHLDTLTRRYTGHPHYYGRIYPIEQATRETRVIVRIHPRRITLDAIHA